MALRMVDRWRYRQGVGTGTALRVVAVGLVALLAAACQVTGTPVAAATPTNMVVEQYYGLNDPAPLSLKRSAVIRAPSILSVNC